jgi:hypothetical protein
VAQVAKEHGCPPDQLGICGEKSIYLCATGTVCAEVYALMQKPEDAVTAFDRGEPTPAPAGFFTDRSPAQSSNPKTLMGNLKVPNLSVVPFTGLIEEARAMEYGAYHAPRKDGGKGYGPFNWRDQNIEYLTYIEAAIRHLASAADREDIDPETGDLLVTHLGLAKATIGILIDAISHGTVLDNRSKTARGVVAALLRKYRKKS